MSDRAWATPGRRRRRGVMRVPPPTWSELDADAQHARLEAIVEAVQAKQALVRAAAADHLSAIVHALRARIPPIQRIFCLGIGTLQSNAAQFQLALLLELQHGFEVCRRAYSMLTQPHPPCTCPVTLYDPQFDAQDYALCGAYALDPGTLAYLPHCPRELYEALLGANWSAERLQGLVLIGNDLDAYMPHEAYPALSRIGTCQAHSPGPHIHRYTMPTCADAPSGALDAVLHTFWERVALQEVPSAAGDWAYRPAPRGRRRRDAAGRAPAALPPAALPPADTPAFWALPKVDRSPSSEVITAPINDS